MIPVKRALPPSRAGIPQWSSHHVITSKSSKIVPPSVCSVRTIESQPAGNPWAPQRSDGQLPLRGQAWSDIERHELALSWEDSTSKRGGASPQCLAESQTALSVIEVEADVSENRRARSVV